MPRPMETLPQLLGCPLRCRMSGDTKMKYPAAIVCQHQEHIQDLKSERRHREEVDGDGALHMVLKEGPPGLGGRPPVADHSNAGLAHLNAEFE